MKRIKAACIYQTILFSQKEEHLEEGGRLFHHDGTRGETTKATFRRRRFRLIGLPQRPPRPRSALPR